MATSRQFFNILFNNKIHNMASHGHACLFIILVFSLFNQFILNSYLCNLILYYKIMATSRQFLIFCLIIKYIIWQVMATPAYSLF